MPDTNGHAPEPQPTTLTVPPGRAHALFVFTADGRLDGEIFEGITPERWAILARWCETRAVQGMARMQQEMAQRQAPALFVPGVGRA